MKKPYLILGGIASFIILLATIFSLVGYFKYMTIDAVELDPELEILIGGGGNSIVLTSEDGTQALVVDTKIGRAAKALRKKVKSKTVVIVNTHLHDDHTGGNELYSGAKLITGAYTKEDWSNAGIKSRFPDETVAAGAEKILHIGSETVHIKNLGQAHTTNDCVVYLEKRKLLMTGDLVFVNMHPVLLAKSGTNVGAWISELGVVSASFDIKTLVPGHGGVTDRNALQAMMEYFVSTGDCAGDKRCLAGVAKKYKNYYGIPGLSGFPMTVKFIMSEKSKRQSQQ